MATYSTDLTTLTTGEAGTWTDFDAPYNSGVPGLSGENFIQGTDCFSVNTGKNVGLEISVVYDHGSGYTFAAGEVVLSWLYYSFGTNLETYANSGWRFGIGSSTAAWDWFRVGGSDYGSHRYGGWFNFAIDPTATETGTIGGGNGGTYQFFGNVPFTLAEVNKGDPVAMDAVRAGRPEISIAGPSGSFAELAEYNDYNVGGTPPGTSSLSIDSGRHVLGLFQEAGGSYLWKGLLAFGSGSNTASFNDSNATITIDDCPHTYPSFNKIEIRETGSAVTLTSITIISTATTANGLGDFEMIDDCNVSLIGCSFNDMGIFTLQSSASSDSSTWNGCGYVIQSGSTFDSCNFNNLTATSSLIVNIPNNISNCKFESDGTNHAVEIIETGSYIWTGNTYTGYTSGSVGNEEVYNNSGGAVTMSIDGGDTPNFRNGAGATTLLLNDKTITFTGVVNSSEIRVYLSGSGTPETEVGGIENVVGNEFAFAAAAGISVNYHIHHLDYEFIRVEDYTIPSTNTELPIQQREDRNTNYTP